MLTMRTPSFITSHVRARSSAVAFPHSDMHLSVLVSLQLYQQQIQQLQQLLQQQAEQMEQSQQMLVQQQLQITPPQLHAMYAERLLDLSRIAEQAKKQLEMVRNASDRCMLRTECFLCPHRHAHRPSSCATNTYLHDDMSKAGTHD